MASDGFAIIQDARAGQSLGIDILALVDRSKSNRYWWTSDDESIAICYRSEAAARFAAGRLRQNNARVVPFDVAVKLLLRQSGAIIKAEVDATWAHPFSSDGLGQWND